MENDEEEEDLTKVHVNLPNHWAADGESLWALPMGNDLYEIRNAPFYAYGINWGDIVRASSLDPELKPEVQAVVRQSGNKTLRIFFNEDLDEAEQLAYLESFEDMDVSYERATDVYLALDVEPEADYEAICEYLDELEEGEVLEYETCEARMPGSFDAAPSNDDGEDEDEEGDEDEDDEEETE